MPSLLALYAAWNDAPPAHLALARIAQYLEAGLGIKGAPAAPRRGASVNPAAGAATGQEFAALAAWPTAPATKYMTAEEYLAQREQARE